MFDKVCNDNGIKHLLTAPYSPTTTGKIERLHRTIRAEFLTEHDRRHATIEEAQAALDAWVVEYNTERPHQSCGGRPPVERFALAERGLVVVDDPVTVPRPRQPELSRPAGVSRWVNGAGRISLAGFDYVVGATFAGEPVEVVVSDGWSRFCTPECWSPPTRSGSSPTRPTGSPRRDCRCNAARATPRSG